MEEETRSRLPTNNSTTQNNTTPNASQSNQVHGTTQQNQSAQDSAGQDTLISTMEQPTGNQTPTTGTDGFTPHRDEGTQMPSQEIHISTINQSTQIPSQQRDPIIAAVDDLEPNHIKTSTPATTVQTTSPGPGIHQGTYSSQPTQPPTPETEVNNTVESRQTRYTHSKPVVTRGEYDDIQIANTMTAKDTMDQHKNKDITSPSEIDQHLVHTNNQRCSLHQGIGHHHNRTVVVKSTSNTPMQPETAVGSPRNNSGEVLEEITVHNDHQNTLLEASTRLMDENISNIKEAHLHNVPNTSEDTGQAPITKNSSHYTPTPTTIATSSSDNNLENNWEATNIRGTQSETSISHPKPTKSQSIITINDRDQPSHQEITISENNDQVSAPNEIRITTQNPSTITIISKRANTSTRANPTPPLHNTNTHRDPNNNVQTDSRNDLPTQSQESTIPTHQTTTRGRCEGTLHRLAQIGKSNNPIQQTSPCRTHPHHRDTIVDQNINNPTWELCQTRDPQGINNFHQDPNGKLTTTSTGFPQCNYCKLPNHSRQRCTFRLKDLDYNIDRRSHPRKGLLTKFEARNYIPAPKRRRSPMSLRLATEVDDSGHKRFWQTRNGYIIYSIDNQPQCSYCGTPSHGRDICPYRRQDETKGLFQAHHPQRGMMDKPSVTPDLIQPESSASTTSYGRFDSQDAQGINNYQINDGKPVVNSKGHIRCNYCGITNHPRANCVIRLRDETDGIRREIHPNRGLRPTSHQLSRDSPNPIRSRPSYSGTPHGRFNSKDAQGINNYQLTDDGKPIIGTKGYVLCNYCGVPSHPRATCTTRIRDEENGIRREIHPNRGLIPSGNQARRDAQATINEVVRKRTHGEQEEPIKSKTRPSPNRKINHQTDTIRVSNQTFNTPTNPTGQKSANLMELPTEIMLKIMQYLPFQDTIRLGRINTRWWQITGTTSLWKDITISNTPLSCGLIAIAINRQVNTLNIRGCSIQGSYIKMLRLGHNLQEGLSKLKFLGLQGYKGSDILAAIIIAESTELDALDLSENRYSLVGTVIGKMKRNNRLTAINLSAIGGHYAEMGGLVYHPFDIHKMKPLIDKCQHLTDIILFGSKLTHEAITYFCENAPPTLLRINIARERAYNDDIRALTSSCPYLQYLNISETSVAYQDIINIVLAWKKTMINLCLPHRLGFVLTLRSRAPNLPLMLQFQTLIKEMEQLKYLHVGHFKFHQADVDNRRPQVARLKSMFPNLVINHNPYSICPDTGRCNIPQSDPSFRFKRNIEPNSWTSRRDAEVVPIFDLN